MKAGFEGGFGYFFSATGHDLVENDALKTFNYIHALECLPVVSTIVGVATVVFFSYLFFVTKSSRGRQFCIAEIIRGVVATSSVGGLVLVPLDIIVTLMRINHQNNLNKLYSRSF